MPRLRYRQTHMGTRTAGICIIRYRIPIRQEGGHLHLTYRIPIRQDGGASASQIQNTNTSGGRDICISHTEYQYVKGAGHLHLRYRIPICQGGGASASQIQNTNMSGGRDIEDAVPYSCDGYWSCPMQNTMFIFFLTSAAVPAGEPYR